MCLPGLSIADMQPIRDCATEQAKIALAEARSATALERMATALEKMLELNQERAEAEMMAQKMLEQLQATQPRRR